MSNSRNTIIRDIFNIASIEDLRDIGLAISQRRNELESRNALNFKIGDSVSFNAKRRGVQVGTIVKINRKTIAVKVGNIVWRVTPSFLSPLHENAAA